MYVYKAPNDSKGICYKQIVFLGNQQCPSLGVVTRILVAAQLGSPIKILGRLMNEFSSRSAIQHHRIISNIIFLGVAANLNTGK